VGTGESHSVREMVDTAFAYAGIGLEWRGEGAGEKAVVSSPGPNAASCLKEGDTVIEIDPRYFRPTEVNHLRADISKAKERLRWEPRVTFDELTKTMVDYDLRMAGIEPPCEGIEACRAKGFLYTDHTYSLYERIREGE